MTVRLRFTHSRRWPVGEFRIPTAADPQRPRVELNRYPGQIIGIAIYPGGRRYLSWVWPVWIVGLRLTDEQFGRQVREVLDNEIEDGAS